ncbi:MAG TPA: hypothetical protein VFJ22_18540 [Dermatophilaceae bacterium]|jgi:hypothetical protein|nr:hypothetical protein [Dermatophilaceae bacterium]
MVPFGLAKAHGKVARAERPLRTEAHRRLATTEPDLVDRPSA